MVNKWKGSINLTLAVQHTKQTQVSTEGQNTILEDKLFNIPVYKVNITLYNTMVREINYDVLVNCDMKQGLLKQKSIRGYLCINRNYYYDYL